MCFLETEYLCYVVALVVRELMEIICLCLPSARIKGVYYHHPALGIILAMVDSHESSFQISVHTQASAGNVFPFLDNQQIPSPGSNRASVYQLCSVTTPWLHHQSHRGPSLAQVQTLHSVLVQTE